jgi:hypothetical protein
MVKAVERDMVGTCRQVAAGSPSALRALVAWSTERMRRWMEGEQILPRRIMNVLGPVWAFALGQAAGAVNGRKRMTTRLATATMDDMLQAMVEEARDEMERASLVKPMDRAAAALAGEYGLDVIRMAAISMKAVLMTYCTNAERDVLRAAYPYVQDMGLRGAFDQHVPPAVANWAQVVEDLTSRGIVMTEEVARQRWSRAWQKILVDAQRLRVLMGRLREAEYSEDADRQWERFRNYPVGFAEWKRDLYPIRRCPEGWVPCRWCGVLILPPCVFCGERCRAYHDQFATQHSGGST